MYKKFILIIILLILACVPRAIELLNHNYLFGYDQGEHLLQVKKIVFDKNLALIGTEVGGQGGFFQGPGWYYLLSIPMILGRGDPYAVMVLMFVIGVGAVICAYILSRKIFDNKTAFFIGLLIAVSPLIIIQSRFIWPPFPVAFLSVFLLFFIYKVLQKKEKYLPLVTFTIGLMTHFETATAATLFVSLIFFSPILFIKKLASLKWVFISILSLIATQLPLIIFDLRNNFLNTKGILNTFFSSNGIKLPISELFANRWGVFKSNFLDTFSLPSFFWPFIFTFIIFGIFLYIKDKKNHFAQKSFVIYLVLSPLVLFLVFMKYGSIMWPWWILELPIYYCFLIGIIFGYLWKNNFLKFIVAGILIVFLCSYIYQTLNFYKNDFNDFGGTHKIKGKIQAIDYIYKDSGRKPFNIMIFSPPIYTYPYEYLLWWYGEKKYNYIPQNKIDGTLYLLMEPDPHKPWTYKGWLETVIKKGIILETKTLPSGFIIQKRLITSDEI